MAYSLRHSVISNLKLLEDREKYVHLTLSTWLGPWITASVHRAMEVEVSGGYAKVLLEPRFLW